VRSARRSPSPLIGVMVTLAPIPISRIIVLVVPTPVVPIGVSTPVRDVLLVCPYPDLEGGRDSRQGWIDIAPSDCPEDTKAQQNQKYSCPHDVCSSRVSALYSWAFSLHT